jgi:hypothetical protein
MNWRLSDKGFGDLLSVVNATSVLMGIGKMCRLFSTSWRRGVLLGCQMWGYSRQLLWNVQMRFQFVQYWMAFWKCLNQMPLPGREGVRGWVGLHVAELTTLARDPQKRESLRRAHRGAWQSPSRRENSGR